MTNFHNFTRKNCTLRCQVNDKQYYNREVSILCSKCILKHKMVSDNTGINRTTRGERNEAYSNMVVLVEQQCWCDGECYEVSEKRINE